MTQTDADLPVFAPPAAVKMLPRWRRPRRVVHALLKQFTPAVRKRGFARIELISRWAEIVGEPYASHSRPERLRFPADQAGDGTLTLRVAGAWGPRFAMAEPMLLQRINQFFGYRAVIRLRFEQSGQFAAAKRPVAHAAPLTPAQEQAIASKLSGIHNDDLKVALARLARHFPGKPPLP